MEDKSNRGVVLSGKATKHQAERMLEDINGMVPCTSKISPNFSKGCLGRFKKCFDLKCHRIYSKAMSANDKAIPKDMLQLLRIIAT